MQLAQMPLYREFEKLSLMFYNIYSSKYFPVKARFIGVAITEEIFKVNIYLSVINRSRDEQAKLKCITSIFSLADSIFSKIGFLMKARIITIKQAARLIEIEGIIGGQLGGLRKSLAKGKPGTENP